MLFVALLTIGSLALVENIESQIKRDREEELIHRGVQYSRAVRHYFKKFGRYPNRIEDLENTNNYRSLRKRYKDPITGKDFKPLHMTDVQMSFAAGMPPGAGVAGAALNGAAANAGLAAMAGMQNRRQVICRPAIPAILRQPTKLPLRMAVRPQSARVATIQRERRSPGFRRRSHRGSGQHQQGQNHPRVQQEGPLQPVAVYLRPDLRPRRTADDAEPAAVAGSEGGAAQNSDSGHVGNPERNSQLTPGQHPATAGEVREQPNPQPPDQ